VFARPSVCYSFQAIRAADGASPKDILVTFLQTFLNISDIAARE